MKREIQIVMAASGIGLAAQIIENIQQNDIILVENNPVSTLTISSPDFDCSTNIIQETGINPSSWDRTYNDACDSGRPFTFEWFEPGGV